MTLAISHAWTCPAREALLQSLVISIWEATIDGNSIWEATIDGNGTCVYIYIIHIIDSWTYDIYAILMTFHYSNHHKMSVKATVASLLGWRTQRAKITTLECQARDSEPWWQRAYELCCFAKLFEWQVPCHIMNFHSFWFFLNSEICARFQRCFDFLLEPIPLSLQWSQWSQAPCS